MDRLWEAVAERGNVCVGLDTAPEHIPPLELERAASAPEAVLAFNRAIVDATIDDAACYKVQIACYEEGGIGGLSAYAKTLSYIRGRGALVIADIKRGDIADTALRYARAHFAGEFEADFVTLSPYMGMDSIEPWLSFARSAGKGAFVLLRTSNPGRRDFQDLAVDRDGKRRLYDAVGEKLSRLAADHGGARGYGAFGAVAGCTEREEAARIREEFGNLFFLIPGYGAQGGAADDAALLLREGNGGVVNASRSILKAWAAPPAKAAPSTKATPPHIDNRFAAEADREAAPSAKATPPHINNAFAAEAAREAVIVMRDAIRSAARKSAGGRG